MKKKLNCICLIDDLAFNNKFHELIIKRNNFAETVICKESGQEALDFLKKQDGQTPELIFLDLNMPEMDGWDFLNKYRDLKPELEGNSVIVMLTNSDDELNSAKSKEHSILSEFRAKPLSIQMLNEIMNTHF